MNPNTEQLLPQAFAMHKAGNVEEAEKLYRTILEQDTANPQVLGMLGMLRMQRGDWKDGVQMLGASLDIDPDQPDTLSNLGYAQHVLGENEEAVESFDRAIKLFPDHVSAYCNRGHALQSLGRYEEAAESYRKALALRPNHAATHVNLGNVYNRLEQHDAALTSYIKALNLSPNDPGILNNLGLSLAQLGRHNEALSYLQRAITLEPAYADAHFNLAGVLQALDKKEEALSHCDRAIELQPDRAEAHYRRGQILHGLMRYQEAENSYRKAIALQPELAGAQTALGALLMETGDSVAATESMLKAIEADPEYAPAFLNLAMLKRYSGDEALFEKLASLHAKRDASSREARVLLDFAMGMAQEERKQYDAAFSAYEEGNSLYYADHPFDEKEEDVLLDSTVTLFTRELFEECRGVADVLPVPAADHVPVFIVGMPRSGTTLIEQILSSHPAVYGAGELEAVNEASSEAGAFLKKAPTTSMQDTLRRLREIGSDLVARVWEQAPDAQYVTDKMPGNFRSLGLIHLMLPNAKIIHAMRDPMDTCFSCYATNFKKEHFYSFDQGALGRQYLRYRKLMAHWHDVLPADSILDLSYEDIVAEPERHVRQLLEYLGLPWDPACLKFYENRRTVSTASVNQVRRPLYSSSVARWKRFEKHLSPLREIIAQES